MKQYVLKSMDGLSAKMGGSRPIEKNLLSLSTLGVKWDVSLIKQIRADAIYNDDYMQQSGMSTNMFYGDDEFRRTYSNISGQNDFIAFYDQTYQMRRSFLRRFALQAEIDYVLETISDDVIINDDMHYFAYPNTKNLKSILKPDKGYHIVSELNNAYRHIYHMFHFNEGNDAWHYVYKFLVDGFLAFEIIYATDKNNNATDIIGFQELDATLLQPQIKKDESGREYKVWVVSGNNSNGGKERELADTNVIYISWAKNNFISHLSYCERLIRSFNMLRTIENSRIIWNIQNAQKRIKIVVPVGTEALQRQKTRLRELEAMYKEDISIDDMSGEITVNGQPKFSFAKNFIFPSKEGTSTEIGEIDVAGHDLNSTEQMKWFWQRFMIETKLPKDRFNMLFDGQEQSAIPDNTNMTREEYRYSLFINRIRDLYKELLIKPMWNQFCIKNPEFADNNVLKNAIGLSYVEDNIFTLAKESANLKMSADIIGTLSAMKDNAGQPIFSTEFLLQKYLCLNDDDMKLNKKLLEDEKKAAAENNAQNAGGMDMGGGMDMNAGGMDMGGGMDMNAGGMDMGGAPETVPAPETEAPAAI